MRWVKDKLGLLDLRPHYTMAELDAFCEDYISQFDLSYPIPTHEYEKIVESVTSDYDSYADLTLEGAEVEGMTEFFNNMKPAVYISNKFSNPTYENRRRSTITHELAHVLLHDPLWQGEKFSLSRQTSNSKKIKCRREDIERPSGTNWLEWQASFGSGSLLMPKTELKKVTFQYEEFIGLPGPYAVKSSTGNGLVVKTKKRFKVSYVAAKVRLLQLGLLSKEPRPATAGYY